MPYGKPRNKKKVQEIKLKILEYLSEGFDKGDIHELINENVEELPLSTFKRYWKNVIEKEDEEIQEQKKELFVGYFKRCRRRIREAAVKYQKTGQREWLVAAHNFEKEFFEKMQSIGLIDKKAEKLEISLTEQILDDLKKAREVNRVPGRVSGSG